MRMNSKQKNTISGCVLIAIGAWAGFAPFLVGDWAWEHTGRFLLTVLPGGAAMLGGLLMLGGRRLVPAGGAVALAAGLWFIAGPPIYALFAGPELGTLASGQSVRMIQWVPFFFGAGIFVSLLSSYVLGFLAPLQFDDELSAAPATARVRVRVPQPPERPRRQRGVKEPVAQPHTRAERSKS